jgi:hypothetical protein
MVSRRPVSNIAFSAGLKNLSHFGRTYRARCGSHRETCGTALRVDRDLRAKRYADDRRRIALITKT